MGDFQETLEQIRANSRKMEKIRFLKRFSFKQIYSKLEEHVQKPKKSRLFKITPNF